MSLRIIEQKAGVTGMFLKSGWLSFLLLFIAFVPLRIWAAERASPVGLWKTEDAKIEIFDEQGKLAGRIAALDHRYTEDGQEKTDIRNPDRSKRDRPLIGLVFMRGFTPAGPGKWEGGTVYDPKSGNTYSASLEYDGGKTLKLRGYLLVSLIGRTAVWTKAE
ncbi:MAG: DUF2147 domain-containing protein [Verrucomicrobia bacterium]|nr:DUF2147 domain-containing protein [Verrucomicrobiota bacterium]